MTPELAQNFKELAKFAQTFTGVLDNSKIDSILSIFRSKYNDWVNVIPHKFGPNEGEEAFGHALWIYSKALYNSSSKIDIKDILFLDSVVSNFAKQAKLQNKYKSIAYHYLGNCWSSAQIPNKEKSIEAHKKQLFYLFKELNQVSFRELECYAYHPCNQYTIRALVNDELNLSAVTTFNDIFDTPYMHSIQCEELEEAFRQTIKVACFTRNKTIPYYFVEGEPQFESEQPKHKNKMDKEEYLNELLWAHYADSHKGICIKYRFSSNMTQYGKDNKTIAFFSDIKYTAKLSNYNPDKIIGIKDAIFYKGTAWEYENESRYICFKLDGKGLYDVMPTKNNIEAIYFGVECPVENKREILNILRNRKLESRNFDGSVISESDIMFYEMEKDSQNFGSIIAVPMSKERISSFLKK